MNSIWENVIKWSEVWGILIPLTIIIRHRIMTPEMRPVILYVLIASILNTIGTIMAVFHDDMPDWLPKNLILYNIHSFIRVVLLGWFIIHSRILQPFRIFKFVIPAYLLFILINFIFLESPFSFSTNLTAVESIFLLSLCISFFLYSIKDDSNTIWIEHPAFMINTGIGIYEVISFFIFLLFDVIAQENPTFGRITMKIFSISYVILCIFLAIALVRSKKR